MDPQSENRSPMLAQSSDSAVSDTIASAQPRPRSEAARVAAAADPDVLLEEIRTHLGKGRYRAAQQLARQAASRFPGHGGLGTMNRGLNGRPARTRPAEGHSRREEFAWLRDPPVAARGKLVALVGSEMVACADSMSELMAALKSMELPKMPLVHRIDS